MFYQNLAEIHDSERTYKPSDWVKNIIPFFKGIKRESVLPCFQTDAFHVETLIESNKDLLHTMTSNTVSCAIRIATNRSFGMVFKIIIIIMFTCIAHNIILQNALCAHK